MQPKRANRDAIVVMQPPSPTITRPLVMWSAQATSLAKRIGSHVGNTNPTGPTLIRLVLAAIVQAQVAQRL